MKLALLVAAGLASAPLAHAQSGCELVDRIIAAAPDAFESLKGEEVDEDWYESKLWLRDADECGVDLTKGSQFYCEWDSENPAAANTQTVFLSESVKLCLGDWAVAPLDGQMSSNNLKIQTGISLAGAGKNAGTVMKVYAEAYENSQERQVWLEVRRP